jgi:3-oxoacyl-[acyl-carrier protein] reductase
MKKVLVSGTSSGLGLEIARDLVFDHKVVGFSRRECGDSLLSQSENYLHISDVDITQDIDKLRAHLADTDILINNIGIAQNSLLATTQELEIERIISINLTSAILLTREYVRARLFKRLPGVVLSISSIIASRGYAGLSVYSASKAGVESFTRSMAREMGSKNFRFNCLAPGYFLSDLSSSLTPDQTRQIVRRTPLGRLANYGDLLPAVRFMVGDDSRFISGQTLTIDGGITV